jgi:hypothetical protein
MKIMFNSFGSFDCSLYCFMLAINILTSLTGFSIVSIHPPPAFGSSPNLEALALEANNSDDQDDEQSVHASTRFSR